MNYTKGECKTPGDVWCVFEEHGLKGTYCPHCDQFAQARALQKQDAIISEMREALKTIQEWLLDDEQIIVGSQLYNSMFIKANNLTIKTLSKAEGKDV